MEKYYTLTENIRAKTGKLLPEPHNSTVVNNQSAGFVDISLQGNNFQDKVNRLGNRAKILQGRFNKDESSLIPQYGMTYKNYVIIGVSKTYYNNFNSFAFECQVRQHLISRLHFYTFTARKRKTAVFHTLNC